MAQSKIAPRSLCLFGMYLFLGTLVGLFFQQFSTTAPLFQDIITPDFSVSNINLLFINLGFHLGFRLNFGTFLGGIFGLWIIK